MIHWFREPQLRQALMWSLLWHLAWVFAFRVEVSSPKLKTKVQETRIYFMGPVLTDEAFDLLLLSRPESSRSEYRAALPLPDELEPQAGTFTRPDPGEFLSVPMGKATWLSIRGSMARSKVEPPAKITAKTLEVFKNPFPVTGALSDREIFYLPEPPQRLLESGADWEIYGRPEFEIEVNAVGEVIRVAHEVSSGNPEVDQRWDRYLRKVKFAPASDAAGESAQKGRIQVGWEYLAGTSTDKASPEFR